MSECVGWPEAFQNSVGGVCVLVAFYFVLKFLFQFLQNGRNDS